MHDDGIRSGEPAADHAERLVDAGGPCHHLRLGTSDASIRQRRLAAAVAQFAAS
jgi:hypothetical protein